MNIVFFGTPEFSAKFLEALVVEKDFSVVAVVTQPDKPVGRKAKITPPPVKVLAKKHGIPVVQPEKKRDIAPDLASATPHLIKGSAGAVVDAFVIVAYGKILPQEVLDIPRLGNINVHPSLLPLYRGPSPIQAAIANRDRKTGVSIMLIDQEMDHGPILAQEIIDLTLTETAETLEERVVEIGAPLLASTLKAYNKGIISPQEQDHTKATFCKLLTKEDGRIDWHTAALDIEAKIRAYTPWPGTWTTVNGKMLKIHAAESVFDPAENHDLSRLEPGELIASGGRLFLGTQTDALEITQLQPEGKPRMSARAYLHGNPTLGTFAS